ncbi:tungstate ABC transporter substrate-binding protein WtpA [Methanofollis fontis]|uniref:Tungstate ABC transporter substrate-binding protein WtpA n=1 Tax=Methanofollis fontis TaxID=2052832 RepID=A0A483CUD7_9EURY|nr:tungstate ABC transporter substrate-binding protein WtpA [Methanofollis fontis]TAJ44507.1 tungstate ABC transporter substrate-binding protein WtpA [Methanofollis fontis]
MKRTYLLIPAVLLLCAAVFLCGCTTTESEGPVTTAPTTAAPAEITGTVTVFHAGSLTAPFEDMEKQFEAAYPGTDVQLVPGGSTKMVKEITELGKSADVLASADYTLIPSLMIPDYTDWYVTFAKNQMVLCYTDDSKYADEINAENWYLILEKEDIAWAFADPNVDPCGYRTPMVIQLAEGYYGDNELFDRIVSANSNITVTEEGGVYTIHATSPEPVGTLQIRPKSVELVQMLESGGLDYAWEYRSVAVQNGLNFVELPEAIDLSAVKYADDYATVQIDTAGGLIAGKPIVYGATVPNNAENPDAGLAFVEMLIDTPGQDIMNAQGQPPIVPAGGFGNVPAELKDLTESS